MIKCFKIVAIFIWAISSFGSFAQNSTKQLVVFTDRNSCISGDSLWFKVRVPIEFNKLGNVVHVQLESDNGNLISSVAVKKENGFAEGFIPVPDSLSTGLFYISSFLNAQRGENEIRSVGKSLLVYNRFAENINQMPVPAPQTFMPTVNEASEIEITIGQQLYNSRDKINGNIIVPDDVLFAVVKAKIVDPFANENSGFINFTLSKDEFEIPVFAENDGILLSGNVSENDGVQQSQELVILSITTEPPYFDYYLSETNGDFHFFLKDAVGNADVVLQTVGLSDKEFNITTRVNALQRTKNIKVDTVFLKPGEFEFVENKLKNSFYQKLFNITSIFRNSEFSMPTPFDMPFYGPPTHRVVPDDFFDLPDFKEISRELLHGVQFRTRNGETTFRLLHIDRGVFFDNEPLRLLNGIPVFKNSFFASLKSTDIRYIDIVQSERIFGDMYFKGVISVLLNNHSNSWLAQQPNIFQYNIPCLQPNKKVAYSETPENSATIPDVRQNYLWEILSPGTSTDFSFNLSDLTGTLEISVEGITSDNQVFKSTKTIEVK